MTAPNSSRPAVEVRDLVKRYPKNPMNAVDGISFTVAPGQILGLLGPNGAGKTTTVGMLTTRVLPSAGTAMVAGHDVVRHSTRARRRLGVVPQVNSLDRSLNVRQNLVFHAAYHGVPATTRTRRAEELLDQFGIGDRAGDKVDILSGGLVQRVMIARSMMHNPEVLFLDEPSNGLDPVARLFLWDRLREVAARGVALVLTTHDMDEAAELADQVGIMEHGSLLALDSPRALTRALPGDTTLDVELTGADNVAPEVLTAALGEVTGVRRVEQVKSAGAMPGGFGGGFPGFPGGFGPFGGGAPAPGPRQPGGLRLRLYAAGEAPALIAPMVAVLARHDVALADLNISKPNLEDVFIHYTGRALS